ncbi:MAG: molybdenum cofactor guanylyltransferase [Nitrospirae bacterium CG_4_9_14_3_um_filter_53_35]|nr:MAG: hypothetical protein AUK29_07830 [Nitrospirae bacterium CG2_30_53_67]PIS38288.1 MAG: molybdenum cofactor guanylyltransferase [Nitrospirae bacterium CG08_land_8_20_14_0_20_52_24]PIV85345.1 MAG: molybdenum cofactor guanylyltransferase [Nitrospirae bacterium CG17_big_fil_post_rev_8_21_14_2_50_50_9]PIW85322.1 MAG: molybdenum cofactor guanylyltransferase [Nitrospirae bacterium CG_4_8_14_3_um_filter_50_41]PIX85628.1 MAG: molybdenum cofactor guanylyltransferase [Nitrospirae bacterium CG_4_10_1
MAGIILSGGENRRMGWNKAFLTCKGRMFIWAVIEALAPLFNELMIVTREPDLYSGFPVRTVVDFLPERGPLTGIFTGVAAAKDEINFCAACDMPLIRRDLVQYMMNLAHGYDAVIPVIHDEKRGPGSRIHPLHAVYKKDCLSAMERHLRQGRRSLHELVSSLHVRYIAEKEMVRFDPELRSIRNINTPDEYQALKLEFSETH